MEAPRTKLESLNAGSLPSNPKIISNLKIGRQNSANPETISPISISNMLFLDEDRLNTSDTSRKYRKSANQNANAANIFRVKAGVPSERKDRMTYIRYQNYTSARTRKTTEQKIFQINNFVKKLTENGGFEDEVPEITETKFKALKKIIEYYDIKNLDRSEYSNVIKSFGLQIGTMKAEQKTSNFSEDKRQEVKKLRAMSLLNRTEKKSERRRLFDSSLIESATQVGGVGGYSNGLQKRDITTERKAREEQPLTLFTSLQVRKEKIKGMNKKFKFSSGENVIIQKINKYRQFLFMLNYSNKLYRPLNLEEYSTNLKFYIGRGNNGNLIRSLMQKRFWFEQTTHEREANFVWTQIKVLSLFNRQPCAESAENDLIIKSIRKSPPKVSLNKNDPIARVLVWEEMREIVALQQSVKNKALGNFQDRLRLSRRRLKKEMIGDNETVHNHFPENGLLGNKKAMFLCLQQYCRLTELDVFDIVPKTFIISSGVNDPQFSKVVDYFNLKKEKKKNSNFWILKPGEFSNRGNGIQCTNKLEDIRRRAAQNMGKASKKTSLIVQEYITRPLLYSGRKFDLRTYMLITNHNAKTKAYWYQDGYVRTSSAFFTLDETDPYIHLTNDAVQQHSDRYGKFQDGNKLSYPELQRYLDSLPSLGRNLDLFGGLIPKMKDIAGLAVRSAWLSLNSGNRDKNFQLFGLDYMVDEDFKPWLIEINTNPCLELSSPVLERLIPHMVQNALRISLDTQFPPPDNFGNNHKYSIPQNSLHYNKFQVIFDSDRDGPGVKTLYESAEFFRNLQGLQEDKNEYQQEGELLNFQDI